MLIYTEYNTFRIFMQTYRNYVLLFGGLYDV